MKKDRLPLVGITADVEEESVDVQASFKLKRSYFEAIEHVGGLPVMIGYPVNDKTGLQIINSIDALLISGGDFDIDPSYFNEEEIVEVLKLIPERTESEFKLLEIALSKDIPVLGICGGMQLINVAFGGDLYQDIARECDQPICHTQSPLLDGKVSHTVYLNEKSKLAKGVGKKIIKVNSTHHQAVKNLGANLVVAGRAQDNLIEAIEYASDDRSVLGVQWHPEGLYKEDESSVKIFEMFIDEALKRSSTLKLSKSPLRSYLKTTVREP
ncbi:MAG: gamma-glutamyl-gamma-aminobutyrate hydrolase family protein [Nitrospinota bacterium]